MVLPGRFDPRLAPRALAALASAVLHLGLLLSVLLSGSRPDGLDTGRSSSMQLVLLEAPDADHREGVDLTPLEPTLTTAQNSEQLHAEIEPPASLSADLVATDPGDTQIELSSEPPAQIETVPAQVTQSTATLVMSQAEQSALAQRLARLAEELSKQPQTQASWEQDGKLFNALLILERANDGTALERVIAEVRAADRGQMMSTRVILKRLAFSQFAQMVDQWDPMVQLHDDMIVGRFHTNSRFNVMHDSRVAPQMLGKVTTAARGFDVESQGRKRESDIFRGGVETRSSRIPLPEALQPSEWAPHDRNARIHELANDTRIRFFDDGSYTWRTHGAPATGYINSPSEHPVYFLAAPGATVYVKGVIAGKVLVYSPQRIVVEGNLTYAHDPRETPASPDYLGLVCDKYIEIAPPDVTGPGDLEIEAAIFAGRRFVVRDIDHRRSATLRIYGSLASGSISASEPRYATKIEYDPRFEQRRPPGFPSTNRFEVENWNGEWTQAAERTADDAL